MSYEVTAVLHCFKEFDDKAYNAQNITDNRLFIPSL